MLAALIRWFFLASITGVIVGVGTSLFLLGLNYLSEQTAGVSLGVQMLLLPLAGLLNGLILYYGYEKVKNRENDSVITAVHERFGRMPLKTGIVKPIAAILTLSFGGSAGKEGPSAHIGGTLASWFARLIRLQPETQKVLVTCGISAGFSSVFGTPLAGTIYGIEVLTIGQLRHDVLFPSLVAGVTSYQVSRWFGIPYSYYRYQHEVPHLEDLFLKMIIIGIFCGLASWLLIEMLERTRTLFQSIQQRFHIWKPAMPLFGGIVLSSLLLFLPTDYLGLSLPLMGQALAGEQVDFFTFFWKALFVAITLGSGFYGGIGTPQFVIGATAGNVIARMLDLDPVLGAAVGMMAVLAACSNTPVAAIVMGFELFGSSIGMYLVTACVTAYYIVGHRSVYPDQRVIFPKTRWMYLESGVSLEREDIHISYRLLRQIKRWRRGPH
nr:chloride channel protein [Ammoniphilus resinae]